MDAVVPHDCTGRKPEIKGAKTGKGAGYWKGAAQLGSAAFACGPGNAPIHLERP